MEKKKKSKVYVFLMVVVFFIALGFLLAISSLLYSTALNLNILHSEMETIIHNTTQISTALKLTNENIQNIHRDLKKVNDNINGMSLPLNSMKLSIGST